DRRSELRGEDVRRGRAGDPVGHGGVHDERDTGLHDLGLRRQRRVGAAATVDREDLVVIDELFDGGDAALGLAGVVFADELEPAPLDGIILFIFVYARSVQRLVMWYV